MKRILFVHHVSGVGGGSYCLLNLVKAIDRSLFEPVVLLKENGTLADEFSRLSVRVVFMKDLTELPYNESLFRLKSIQSYWRAFRSLNSFGRVLQEEKVDIVYLNNMMISPYLVPAKKNNCQTVMHVREHWPLDEHRTQLGWIRRIAGKYCDKLIAINGYSASMFPGIKATVIHDWIDMSQRQGHISVSDLFGEDMSGKKLFLFMGGIQRIKGAYEVMKTFCTKLTDPSYRLLVLGCTKELSGRGIVKRLKSTMCRLGIPPYEYKVKMLARNDPRVVCIPGVYDVKSIYEQSFCMLSYYTIPHANLSMAEAIVLGVPVIAADTEEAREYSLDGRMASLFPINSMDAFGRAIDEFVKDGEELRSALASQDRAKVEELFSPDRNIALLNSTLSGLAS